MVALSARLDEAKVIDRKVGDIAERYELGEMLGEGRFSKVYSATKGRMHVALKEMDMATLEEDEEAVDALVQETTALRRAYAASSKHVPKLHEVVQVGEDMLYVVMDQVRGCELFELLEGGSLSEPSARRLIAQLISALSSLHRHNVVHRDVKPENLMVSDIGDPSKCRLVVIDFGYAALETAEGLTELAGSPEYAAPEVLAWLDDVGQPYTKACDMWSVGVTAYVLLVGELPHDLPGEGDLYAHVRDTPPNFKQPFWSSSPEAASAKDFVLSCMQVEPTTRLSATHGLQHAWFAPRPDDNKSVVIGSSLAAFASLKRRVAGLSTVSSQKRRAAVSRWMGKLTVSMRRGPAHVQDQCVRPACPLTPPPFVPLPSCPPSCPGAQCPFWCSPVLVRLSPSPSSLSLLPLPPPLVLPGSFGSSSWGCRRRRASRTRASQLPCSSTPRHESAMPSAPPSSPNEQSASLRARSYRRPRRSPRRSPSPTARRTRPRCRRLSAPHASSRSVTTPIDRRRRRSSTPPAAWVRRRGGPLARRAPFRAPTPAPRSAPHRAPPRMARRSPRRAALSSSPRRRAAKSSCAKMLLPTSAAPRPARLAL